MTPAAAAALAPAPAPAGLSLRSAAESGNDDDDPLVNMIDEYWATINRLRQEKDKRAAAQFYTQATAASLLAETVVPDPASETDCPLPGRIIDYSCGAGMLPLFAVRRVARLYAGRISETDAVRRAWIGDIDLGALTIARRVLSAIAPPAVPHAFWSDALFDFTWTLGRVEIDPLDIDRVDEANAQFARRRADYVIAGHSIDLKDRPTLAEADPMVPLGTVHVPADSPIEFHWAPEAAARCKVVHGTYHQYHSRDGGGSGGAKEASGA